MSDHNTDTSKIAETVLRRLGNPSISDTLLVNAAVRLTCLEVKLELVNFLTKEIPSLLQPNGMIMFENFFKALKEFELQ